MIQIDIGMPRVCLTCKLEHYFNGYRCIVTWEPTEGVRATKRLDNCPLHESVTIKDTADKIKVTNCNDNISRQQAIDAMCAACGYDCDKSEFNYNAPQDEQVILCPEHYALAQLPSAQQEIIRCKDCRWGKEVCGNIECFVDINVPPEYHGYEWFCPNGERRTDESD